MRLSTPHDVLYFIHFLHQRYFEDGRHDDLIALSGKALFED